MAGSRKGMAISYEITEETRMGHARHADTGRQWRAVFTWLLRCVHAEAVWRVSRIGGWRPWARDSLHLAVGQASLMNADEPLQFIFGELFNGIADSVVGSLSQFAQRAGLAVFVCRAVARKPDGIHDKVFRADAHDQRLCLFPRFA